MKKKLIQLDHITKKYGNQTILDDLNLYINENEFEVEVLKEDGVVVVDFSAAWCGPCKMMAPILEQVQDKIKDVKIIKVDVDENPNLADEYEVRNIPTIKVFKEGEVVSTKVGFLPKASLIEMIEKTL